MPIVSIVFGLMLVALGAWGYSASDLEGALKLTALIPAAFGVLLAVCGVVGMKESRLKHAMHAAAMVGLLGFLLAAGRFLPKFLREGLDTAKLASLATGGMMVLCGLFVILCVNSFIQARRRRKASEEGLS